MYYKKVDGEYIEVYERGDMPFEDEDVQPPPVKRKPWEIWVEKYQYVIVIVYLVVLFGAIIGAMRFIQPPVVMEIPVNCPVNSICVGAGQPAKVYKNDTVSGQSNLEVPDGQGLLG